MLKTDCKINNWVASWMVDTYDWITNATADCKENYGIDDIVFSATTSSGEILRKFTEVKSLKGGYQFKHDGQWNKYFSASNPDGIVRKMKFGNVPPSNMDILELPYNWEPTSFVPEYAPMPEEWEGKNIYILNALDKFNRAHNSKTYKVFENNASLCYVAPDGLILFSPKTLREAFLGYAWFQVKSHTAEIGDVKYCPAWELKCVFDLDKGIYHEATPPRELFIKK